MTAARDELTVRDATEADVPRLVELMAASLGTGGVPRSAAFFRWKHFDNPFGASPVLVAEDRGRLVGLRTFLRWELRRGEGVLHAVRAVDTATHPAYRGRGIFRRLTLELLGRMKAEGVDFVFNTPNAKSGPGYLKMGWRTVGLVPVFLRPRLALAMRPFRRSDWGEVTEEERAALRRAAADRRPDAWVRAAAGPNGHTPRSPAYLRWRYLDIPGIEYGAAFHPASHLLVFRRRLRRGLRELTLCEVALAPGPRAAAAAARALRAASRGADVVTMSAAVDTRLRRLATLVGFAPIGGPLLMSRPLASPPIESFTGWWWSLGDLELF